MAKIAGRKTTAAWQAANNYMANTDPTDLANLAEAIESAPEATAAYNQIKDTYQLVGIGLPLNMASMTSWVSSMTILGIPLDVWMGKTSYDIYEPQTVGSKVVYEKQIEPLLAKFAVVLRHLLKISQFAYRQTRWLAKDTHPPTPPALVRKMTPVARAEYHKKRHDQLWAAWMALKQANAEKQGRAEAVA